MLCNINNNYHFNKVINLSLDKNIDENNYEEDIYEDYLNSPTKKDKCLNKHLDIYREYIKKNDIFYGKDIYFKKDINGNYLEYNFEKNIEKQKMIKTEIDTKELYIEYENIKDNYDIQYEIKKYIDLYVINIMSLDMKDSIITKQELIMRMINSNLEIDEKLMKDLYMDIYYKIKINESNNKLNNELEKEVKMEKKYLFKINNEKLSDSTQIQINLY